jgi:hypothetical protein
VATIPALGVDGLVGCDRVEPGSKPPAILEMLLLEMDLQKRRLENILRHLRATEVAPQIAEQLGLVPVHERLEGRRIVVHAEPPQQFLVGMPPPVHQARLATGMVSGRGVVP